MPRRKSQATRLASPVRNDKDTEQSNHPLGTPSTAKKSSTRPSSTVDRRTSRASVKDEAVTTENAYAVKPSSSVPQSRNAIQSEFLSATSRTPGSTHENDESHRTSNLNGMRISSLEQVERKSCNKAEDVRDPSALNGLDGTSGVSLKDSQRGDGNMDVVAGSETGKRKRKKIQKKVRRSEVPTSRALPKRVSKRSSLPIPSKMQYAENAVLQRPSREKQIASVPPKSYANPDSEPGRTLSNDHRPTSVSGEDRERAAILSYAAPYRLPELDRELEVEAEVMQRRETTDELGTGDACGRSHSWRSPPKPTEQGADSEHDTDSTVSLIITGDIPHSPHRRSSQLEFKNANGTHYATERPESAEENLLSDPSETKRDGSTNARPKRRRSLITRDERVPPAELSVSKEVSQPSRQGLPQASFNGERFQQEGMHQGFPSSSIVGKKRNIKTNDSTNKRLKTDASLVPPKGASRPVSVSKITKKKNQLIEKKSSSVVSPRLGVRRGQKTEALKQESVVRKEERNVELSPSLHHAVDQVVDVCNDSQKKGARQIVTEEKLDSGRGTPQPRSRKKKRAERENGIRSVMTETLSANDDEVAVKVKKRIQEPVSATHGPVDDFRSDPPSRRKSGENHKQETNRRRQSRSSRDQQNGNPGIRDQFLSESVQILAQGNAGRENEPDTDGTAGLGKTIRHICIECGNSKRASKVVLCKACSEGCHIFCMRPARANIPLGVWICPRCHKFAKRHEIHLSRLRDYLQEHASGEAEVNKKRGTPSRSDLRSGPDEVSI